MNAGPVAAMQAGTIVIGGGIVGRCLAWFLAEAGEDVLCLDDGRHAGSTANAGSLHVQMQSRFIRLYPDLAPGVERALPMYPLAVRHWERLAGLLDTDIGLRLTGGLMVAETAEQLGFLEQKCRREERLGLSVRMLDRAALERLAPYLGPAVIGAEFCADEGKLNPLLANAAVTARATALGARIRSATARHLERDGAGFAVRAGGFVARGRRVVLAAGSRSGALAAMLGGCIPTRPEPLHVNITEATVPLIAHLVQHADRPITMKQLGAGQVVVGGGWPARLDPTTGHPTVELSSILGNLALARHIVPAVGGLRLLRTWAGVNTSVDGRAVLGELAPGAFVAIPGDAGYTLGPLCARLVADTMLGHPPDMPIAEYAPGRFMASA
jgi:glycine/D-amino acid oxidase-like deaminating enzyme